MILMHHPESGNFARATEQALDLAHSKRGWERVDPQKVKKDDLAEAAKRLGVPVDTSQTKAEIAGDLAGDDD